MSSRAGTSLLSVIALTLPYLGASAVAAAAAAAAFVRSATSMCVCVCVCVCVCSHGRNFEPILTKFGTDVHNLKRKNPFFGGRNPLTVSTISTQFYPKLAPT